MKEIPLLEQQIELEDIHRRVAGKNIGLYEAGYKKRCVGNQKRRMAQYTEHLRAWDLRYDFELWQQAETHLSQIWRGLRDAIHLSIEYGLYEEVASVFLEIRHLLQSVGLVKERLYIAAWLKTQAEVRNDWVVNCIATSALAWSYTSSGYYQDLEKAENLWNDLMPLLSKIGKPNESNKYRKHLTEKIDNYPYDEVLISAYETGARIAIRCNRLDDAHFYLEKGRDEITVLSARGLLSARLEERFDMAFRYHEGVAYYLSGKLDQAQEIFNDTIHRGRTISWERIVQGAKSWLATIAMVRKEYETCEDLLADTEVGNISLPSKREGIFYLLKAQLFNVRGQREKSAVFEESAVKILNRFFESQHHSSDSKTEKIDAFSSILAPL